MQKPHLSSLFAAALLTSSLLAFGGCNQTPEAAATPEAVAPAAGGETATAVAAATAGAPAGADKAPGCCGEGKADCAGHAGGECDCAGCAEGGHADCPGHKGGECDCAGHAGGHGDCAGHAGGHGDCAGHAGGGEHADCGGHAAGGEGDCPFAEAKAAAASEGEEMGCPHAAAAARAAAAEQAVAAPEGEHHYGAAFALSESKPLAAVLADQPEPTEAQVQVSGVIDQVCQKRGCWLVMRDGDKTARITMMDHAFVVPIDSKGKQVVVEGTLGLRTFDEAQVKHLEADRGGNPEEVSGTRTEVVVKASGVRIRG
ncbi:MAG: DUF4920 domain-containing protein [Deltaproteobacteria bacterium]|nr:DUF4920 domain-containing protein [Deltaproteobacteria bacterium]MCB9788639.1 DUF4920 domain-containing protein [Deltaproteobacteria bacterium]